MRESVVHPDRQSVLTAVLPGTAMIAVTFGLGRYGYGLLLPDMRAELGVSTGAAGVISSAAGVSYLVGNLAVVPLTSRRGSRVAVAAAALFAAVGMCLVAISRGTASLALGVIVAGTAAGLALPPYADIVAARIPAERRKHSWSIISSGTGWGVAIAGPVAIVAGSSWRIGWLLFAVLALAAGALATVRAGPATNAERTRRTGPPWFRRPTAGALVVSAVLIGAGSAAWWAFSVDALRAESVGTTAARIIYALTGAASLLGSFNAILVARLGLPGSYLTTAGGLGLAIIAFALLTGHPILAAIAAAAFGATYAAVVATQGLWSAQIFPEHPTAGVALFTTALTAGTLVGPTVSGLTIEHLGYRPTFLSAGALVLAALLVRPNQSTSRGTGDD
ncbi:MFS transporter [Kribbella albertanoniae]|uniref:MFS transporter n=1 Tax=Kribbella albertanoniae TaxID=1266829 RepID=A0A4R4QB69_9ACTN|nr:MFS transporter [Kribbella albertanoniae]TDC32302.1 MFS transporter [Kribbella albertanoniae]